MAEKKSATKSENVVPMKRPKASKAKASKVSAKKKPAVKKKAVKAKAKTQAPSSKKAVSPNVPGTTGVVKAAGAKAKQTKKPVEKVAAKVRVAEPAVVKKSEAAGKEFKGTNFNVLQFQTMEETMTQNTQQFDAYTKEAAEMGRQGFDAAMKSSTIFAKGFEEIMRASVAMAQSAAEKQAAYAKEAMSSKTINEWTELQSKVAQTSFDDFMEGATKLSEMAVKTLTDASEPVNEQMTKAVNAAQKAA